MKDRSATYAIKGYIYQFDLTILKILQLKNNDDSVTVEGREDVDVKTVNEETAIQCKYHAETDYNHSLIAKPIKLMLTHFKKVLDEGENKIKYLYLGCFNEGQEKLTQPITLDFLKLKLLTYKKGKKEYKHHEDLKLNDEQLQEFLNLLQIDINAKNQEEQLKDIYAEFKRQMKCNDIDKHLYYNNALNVISTLAVKKDIEDRKISKGDFISKINSKNILFNKWFIEIKGKKQLFSSIRSKYFTTLNISPFERFFLIEINPNDYIRSDLKDIIILIFKKWAKVESKIEKDSFCPYLYIHGISADELSDIKNELRNEGNIFIDGFDFANAKFNLKSIIKQAKYHNQIKVKFINEMAYIDLIIEQLIYKTKEIYQFYINKPYFDCNNNSVKHVKIQIEQLDDIKEII